MSDVFFTADEHYGHDNIIKFCNRPFADVIEMQEGLIANHNAKVKKCDLTYHIGDMFWRNVSVQDAADILRRLNGKHYLIRGNHEETGEKLVMKFEWLRETALIKPRAQFPPIWLSHYAHRSWPKSHQGSWHVFGHTHAVLPDYRRSHDVGVDANDYAPVSLDELATLMNSKVIEKDEIEKDMEKNQWTKENKDSQ